MYTYTHIHLYLQNVSEDVVPKIKKRLPIVNFDDKNTVL